RLYARTGYRPEGRSALRYVIEVGLMRQSWDYHTAEDVVKRLFELKRIPDMLGKNHPETAAWLIFRALCCVKQGKLAEAESLTSQAMKVLAPHLRFCDGSRILLRILGNKDVHFSPHKHEYIVEVRVS